LKRIALNDVNFINFNLFIGFGEYNIAATAGTYNISFFLGEN
jgi:hypothetical protein